jgi:hypothetical protein
LFLVELWMELNGRPLLELDVSGRAITA